MKNERSEAQTNSEVLQMFPSQIDGILTKLDATLKKFKHPQNTGQQAVYEAEQTGLRSRFERMTLRPDTSTEEKSAGALILADLYCAIRVTKGINIPQRDLREYFLNQYLDGTLLSTVKTSLSRRIDRRVQRAREDPNLTAEQKQAVYTSANLLKLSMDRGYPNGISHFGEELVSLTDRLIGVSEPNE